MKLSRPRIEFLKNWTLFAPFARSDEKPSPDDLTAIPKELSLDGKITRPIQITGSAKIDLAPYLGAKPLVEKIAIIYIPFIVSDENQSRGKDGDMMELFFGVGADWWYEAWIDGRPAHDTLLSGNQDLHISHTNHKWRMTMRSGTHLLVIRFISGSSSSVLCVDALDSRQIDALLATEILAPLFSARLNVTEPRSLDLRLDESRLPESVRDVAVKIEVACNDLVAIPPRLLQAGEVHLTHDNNFHVSFKLPENISDGDPGYYWPICASSCEIDGRKIHKRDIWCDGWIIDKNNKQSDVGTRRMTHRERLLAVVEHRLPDQMPTFCPFFENPSDYMGYLSLRNYDELQQHFDFCIRCPEAVITQRIDVEIGTFNGNVKGKYTPLADAETVADVEKFDWPSGSAVDEKAAEESIARAMRLYAPEYALKIGAGPSLVFNLVLGLYGMETGLMNMYLKPEIIESTIEHILLSYLPNTEAICRLARGKVDFIQFTEDFGTQNGMMISPELWRKFFKPAYRKLFSIAKQNGLKIWLHACGGISEVLPDLIDMGVDVWETVQTQARSNDPIALKKNFGKDITFFGAINTQHVLTQGTADDVRREVRAKIRALGQGGGFICGPDHVVTHDAPLENTIAMYEEIRTFREKGITA